MLKLLSYLKGYRVKTVLGPIFKLVEAVLELIVPLVVAEIIDTAVPACESVFMCEYRPRLKLVPKPIDARDAKNCATSAKPSPTAASRNMYMPQRTSGP